MIESAVEKWVYFSLVSDPRTAAWFGLRVTPIVAIQGTTRDASGAVLPFATYKRVSTNVEPYLDLSTPEAPAVQITVDIHAETYEQVKPAAEAVRSVLHRATVPAYGTTLAFSLLKVEADDIAVPTDGKGVPLYAVTQTYEIRFQESF